MDGSYGGKGFLRYIVMMALLKESFCTSLPATCEDVYHKVSTSSGVYSLVSGSQSFKAFCQFNDDSTGYFFPSMEAVQNHGLNLEEQFSDHKEFIFRVINDDGSQMDAKQEQLEQYNYQNLTITLNYCEDPNCPHYGRPPYIQINFVKGVIKGVNNGLRSNGQDLSFTNCDTNSNSYIVVFFGDRNHRENGIDWRIMEVWRGLFIPTRAEYMIPEEEAYNFQLLVEHGFGGCGASQTSKHWPTYSTNPIHAQGAAIGLKFKINSTCSGQIPCGNHGDCVDTIRSHYHYCECHDGYIGNQCNYAYKYIGCFGDMEDRAMNGPYTLISETLDVISCAEECIGKGYPYVGLQNGDSCYCGEEYNRYGQVDENECDTDCSGDSHQICGALFRNSVYKVYRRGISIRKYRKNTEMTTSGQPFLASVQSNIGSIDCLRIAFDMNEANSYRYEAETEMCHIYTNDDGVFKKEITFPGGG